MTILEGQIATKVSQQDFNELGERVSSAETQITQKADSVTVTALQTTVDEVSGQVTENAAWIEANADKVASQITREEFDELGGEVSSNTSLIEQTAEAIRSEVSTATGGLQTQITQQAGEIDLKASQSDVDTLAGRVTTAEATIEAQANQIALRVTTTDFDAAMNDKLDADAPSVGVNTESGIVINETGVYVEGQTIDLRTSDGDEYVNISESGVSASSITAPNVMVRYDGPNQLYVNPDYTSDQIANGIYAAGDAFRSLQEAFDAISYRVLTYGVTINIASGKTLYGDAVLSGCISNSNVTVTSVASNPPTINGQITIKHSLGYFLVQYLKVNASNGKHGIYVYGNGIFCYARYCVITGTGSSSDTYGLQASVGAKIYAQANEIYNCECSLVAQLMGELFSRDNKGNCAPYVANATMRFFGTVPNVDTSFWYYQYGANAVYTSGVSVDQGSSSGGTVPTIYTMTANVSVSDTYFEEVGNTSDASWNGSAAIRQGFYYEDALTGCMWFNNTTLRSTLSGKTILTATLRLSAYSSTVGRDRSKAVTLYGTAMTSGRTGKPVLTTSYGVIISAISKGETVTATIPTAAITDLVNGTINGFALNTGETAPYKDEYEYSSNYARFYGTDGSASTIPMLTITYEG